MRAQAARAFPCQLQSRCDAAQVKPERAPVEARDGDRQQSERTFSPPPHSRGAVDRPPQAAPAQGLALDRHVESSTWQTRCSSMPPTRKRPGSWWCAVRRSRSSTSNPLAGSSCAATSISPRSRGSNRRCRPPSSNTAATGTASSPSAKSIPTTTRSPSPTGRRCSRRRRRPRATRSTRTNGAAAAARRHGASRRDRQRRPRRRASAEARPTPRERGSGGRQAEASAQPDGSRTDRPEASSACRGLRRAAEPTSRSGRPQIRR